ncbi:cellulose-binding domain-containing protein [Actinacidiphila bryophytorum]|uniref:Right handed beta helix region n=1 Tax=Actinacidiphila bryophytorum TaxID=1436133 RepID=A0A9W4E7R5_9ACTN|nr:cellulose-binding domain-containing protein [Actinacidiphila bryophytorum]MBN6543481.1 cellulose binding domain-containing protein [Actinacidiphila bryophytorum]CAG7614187.1 Right handed beta helix region [Actinacidiphila bryophytorum]
MITQTSAARPGRHKASSAARRKALAAVAVAALASAGALVALESPASQAATPAVTPALNSNALYVSASGSASAPGTLSSPTTLAAAVTKITAGGTIYMRGGTYNLSSPIEIQTGNSGSSGALKEISAYPGEKPVLDFSGEDAASSDRGIQLNGNYWHLYGLTVQHAADNGIFVGGSNNVVERVVTAYNRDTGLQISRPGSSTPQSQWPANNLIVSSESHDNRDATGENADGFAAKLTVGSGNVFRYDVSHNNVDDGWDLFTKPDTGPIGAVTIENSLSYSQGTLSDGSGSSNGDKNGFKLGGDGIPVNHIFRNNIAYGNGAKGITYNDNPGTMSISNNVSINNANRNFSFDAGTSVFRNNTSCRFNSGSTTDKIVGNSDSSNQFWSGSNGSRCPSYSGALGWSFASDGSLIVTFGGTNVTGGTTTGGSTTGGSTTSGTTTTGGTTTGGTTGGTGSSSCKVTYTPSTWPGGFTTNITVANTGSTAVNGWKVAFTLPSGQAITSTWSATISPSSGAVTATNVDYNAQIPAGGSQSFGFQGTYTGSTFTQPTAFTLNGTTCTTG